MHTSPSRRRLPRAVAGAATLISLLGAGLSGPVAPASAAAAPLLGAPEVGRCYQITQAEADARSTTAPTVDCAEEHRLQIFAVVEVPARIGLKGKAFYDYAARTCNPLASDLLGDGGVAFRRSAYEPGWLFVPTREQQAEGARWVACMIGVAGGLQSRGDGGAPSQGLEETRGTVGTVSGRLPRDRRLCIDRLGGAIARTHCARRHSHVMLGSPVSLQGPARVRDERAVEHCRAKVRRAQDWIWIWSTDLDDPRRFTVACFVPR
ncbi:septum formation family protein [Nocardioides sp.]|uniref:septum formation family protein n=1 Tax=Nocardioides sp. TaxID=35761 RepID=UPI0035144D27